MEPRNAVVIVTGAAGAIGKEIALAYAAKGARIAAVDLAGQPLEALAGRIGSDGGEALAVPCDITSRGQVEAMMGQVVGELGPPDILINSAGSLSALGPVWQVDPQRWQRDVHVNLCGTFLVCREAVGHMVRRRGGYVINLVGAGVFNVHLCTTAYDCSKAGVVRLTEALALEAGESGVRAFALYPGVVRSAMTEFIATSPEGRKHRPTFANIFAEGRDVPACLAAKWCLHLTGGRADRLSGRWFDATEDFDETIGRAEKIVSDELLLLRLRRP